MTTKYMAAVSTEKPKRRKAKVPDYLIYEVLGDRPLYYKGDRDVVNGLKKPADIMGCGDIQGLLVGILYAYIFNKVDRKVYRLATNEVGINAPIIGKASHHIAIFEKALITELRGKYFSIPPKIAIDVDIKIDIDPADYPGSEEDYVFDKTDKLLAAGVEKVIWITTRTKKTVVATKGKKWIVQTWQDDLDVLEGCTLNLTQILADEDIMF